MKERPILFSAPMVEAILNRRKTQTRRIVKPQPLLEPIRGPEIYHPVVIRDGMEEPGEPVFGIYDESGEWGVKCPYGQPGDRIWVKETWRTNKDYDSLKPSDLMATAPIRYEADGAFGSLVNWYPSEMLGRIRQSIFMRRWMSRITLEITGIRVERLQEISPADAVAEGVGIFPKSMSAQKRFREVWESINGPGSWETSPWVWVVEFMRIV